MGDKKLSTSQVVESVTWNDLEQMRPMDTIIFKDPLSIDLITEYAEANKDWISCVCAKVGLYDYCVYFKEIKNKGRWWHNPRALSAEFMEEHLFRMRNSNIVTSEQLRDRVMQAFAANRPEKLSPIYEHQLD